jgi:hypothetical protein
MVEIFDQGQTGSCTGQAATGDVGTGTMWVGLAPDQQDGINEDMAMAVYSKATTLDEWAGEYPPDDFGSSGLAAAKACKQMGLISGYLHCFTLEDVLGALSGPTGTPLIIGINWYANFDDVDATGLVRIGGAVMGGHEVCVVGIDVDAQTVECANSWGEGWGLGGFFTMGWADLDRLLGEDGDATILLPLTAPAPIPVPVPSPAADVALAAALKAWLKGCPFFYRKVSAAARAWLAARGL